MNKPFEWGLNDCSTLIWNWLKIKYPQNKLRPLEYKTEREAIKFSKLYKWEEELKNEFEIEIVVTNKPEDELIYINQDKGIEAGHLTYNGRMCSVDKYLNFVQFPIFQPLRFIKCLQQSHF